MRTPLHCGGPVPAAATVSTSPEPDAAFLVTLTGIGVTVEGTPVLRSFDLALTAGRVLGVMGGNGSGKSTLLRLLATLVPPCAGSGQVLGAKLGSQHCREIRPRIALVEHDPAVYRRLTLGENLELIADLTGNPRDAVGRALRVVGLERAAERRADRCSRGMLQRVEMARVLITRPTLLLLDEPHVGLDSAAAGLVDLLVGDVRRRGGASIVVSHDRERLDGLVDATIELIDGRAMLTHTVRRVS